MAADHVIDTTETKLNDSQKAVTKISLNDVTLLNLIKIKDVKITEVQQTTEYTTVNNSTMLKKLQSPKKCTCIKKRQLKFLTEDSAGITESSVKAVYITERLPEKTTERGNENLIKTIENPLKSTTKSSVNISKSTKRVKENLDSSFEEMALTDLERKQTTLPTFYKTTVLAQLENNIENTDNIVSAGNISLTEFKLTHSKENSISVKLTVKPNGNLTENTENPANTDNSSVSVTVKPNVNLTVNSENPANTFNSTENSGAINSSDILIDYFVTDNIAVNVTVKPNVNLTVNTENPANIYNATAYSHHVNNSNTLTVYYLTDNSLVNITVKPNVNLTFKAENPANSFNSTQNPLNIDNSEMLHDFYLTDTIPVILTVTPNVNLTFNVENSSTTLNLRENVKETYSIQDVTNLNLTDIIPVTVTDKSDVILIVSEENAVKKNVNLTVNSENHVNTFNSTKNLNNINNSEILTDFYLTDNSYVNITVKPNVNLTVNANNSANSLNLTQNLLNINNSDIFTVSYLTDNFTVNTAVTSNVNLTVNFKNPVNNLNSTTNSFSINNNTISIDSYTTDIFNVALTVTPHVNLTVNTTNSANILNSTAVNRMITESAKNHSYFFNLTDNSTDVTENAVNLTENVKQHNGSKVNSFDYYLTKTTLMYLSEKPITKISTDYTTGNNDSVNLTVITVNTTEKNYPADTITAYLNISSTKNPINFLDLTENSTEPLNISMIREFTVNLTEEITLPTNLAYNLTEISLHNVTNENLTQFPLVKGWNSNFYPSEGSTEFEIANNTLTDLTVNITELIETVNSTKEVMLTELSKNLYNKLNFNESSTDYLNINTETDINVNLTAKESDTTVNFLNLTENYENTLNSFAMESNPVTKDNTVITANVKENYVNVDNVTASMITEVTKAENVNNILSEFYAPTTEETTGKLKTDFIEYNSTENSNVTNIKLTANLTESSDIDNSLVTQNKPNLSSSTIEIVTLTTSTTSYDYQLVDVTTIDPRLPFRSIECVGPTNRRKFKASECYQYYQCFAGWAFLLNCHEGWRFEATEGQCILDTNKECEL
ncbi:hypothetical protein CVS40_5905 [Lucilia cuprina]|nr:hypothetical protein CVS40_5905 [Lucilia cuprina]